MTTFNKKLQRTLLIVLALSTLLIIWISDGLSFRRNLHFHRISTNSKNKIIDAPDFNMDMRIRKGRKIINFRQNQLPNNTKVLWSKFSYPLNVNMVKLVRNLKANIPVRYKALFVYDYKVTHHRVDKCVDGSPFFIFLIKSAVSNIRNRAAIRQTWSHSSLMEKYNGVRLFLLGTPDTQLQLSAVKEENNLHKDIIQMSFRDNYYNNTLKTIGAIHWTVKHCNRSKFVVFVDDDMLVSTARLVKFLKSEVNMSTFFGGYITSHSPFRNKKSKWYVSKQDYQHKVYPPMASAGLMIMSMNFVIDLHFASQYTKKFIYDDAYLAILAYKLHVTPVNIHNVFMRRIPINSKVFNTSMIAAHRYPPVLLRRAWRVLQ